MQTHRVRAVVAYNLENQLPREMLAHEVPVMQAIHGFDSVTVVAEIEGSKKDVPSRQAFVDLKKKFAKSRDEDGNNPVDAIYPDGSRDLERFYKGELFTEEAEEQVEEEVDDLASGVPQPVDNRPEIIAKLEEMGIPFSKTTNTKHLASLLEDAERAAAEEETE